MASRDANASVAQRNEQIAEVQKIEADKQRDAAEMEAYVGDIALGQTAIENGNWPEARRRLDACPTSKRGFEWKFLSAKAWSVVARLPDIGGVLSPDGRLWLADAGPHAVQLWDLSGNPVGGPMKCYGSSPHAVFSPDGHMVVTNLENGNRQLWNLAGKPVGIPIKTGNIPIQAVCSPDGRHVLTMPDDNTVQLQDVSGRLVGEAIKHAAAINSVVFSPDGRLILTAAKDGTARLWDVAGRPVGETMREGGSVDAAAFSPDGRLLMTRSNNDVVRLWDLTGKPVGKPMKSATIDGLPLGFSPDSRMIITYDLEELHSLGHTIRHWDLNGKPLDNWDEYRTFNESAGFSPDGRLRLTLADDGRAIQLRDAAGEPVGEPMQSEGRLCKAAFSPDGRLVVTASSGDCIVRLWDLNGRPVGQPMPLNNGGVNNGETHLGASFTPDSRWVVTSLVSGGWRQICVWDFQGRLMGATGKDMSVSTDYMADHEGDALILPGDKCKVVRTDHVDSPVVDFDFDASLALDEIGALNAVAHRPSATPAASIPARTIRFAATGNNVELVASGVDPVILCHDQKVTAAAVSPDGLRAVTAAGSLIRFWDTASGRETADIPASTEDVRDLQFTPDGAQLVLASADGGVQIWDSRPFEERQRDRDARFAESKPAMQYVDHLLTTATPSDRLAEAIRGDMSLNAIRKVQALLGSEADLLE